MNYLPSDDQFGSAPASSAHVAGRRVGDCATKKESTPSEALGGGQRRPRLLGRTCVLCPGAHGHGAGLSHSHAVPGQHPELVLHPGVEVHHGGRQRAAVDDLGD